MFSVINLALKYVLFTVRQLIAGPNFFNQRGPPAVFDVRMPGIGIPVTTIPPLSGMPPTATIPPSALVNSYPMNPAYNPTGKKHTIYLFCLIDFFQ